MTMNMKHKENMEKLHARLLTLKANEAMVITLAWLQQFERMADTHTTNIRGCKYSPAIYIHTPALPAHVSLFEFTCVHTAVAHLHVCANLFV